MSTAEQIRQFIRETFFVDSFSGSASFLQSGVIDSTGMLELITFVERTFDVQVEDWELLPENLDSLDRLTSFIDRKRLALRRP